MIDNNTVSTRAEFKKILSESGKPVIVKFFATWCGPCKMVAPVFEKLSKEFENQIKFIEIDIDNCDGIASDYFVSSVPTFISFRNGEELNRMNGAASYDQLETFIKNATAVI